MVQALDEARRRRPPGGGSGARVPPHNLEAEESLLGAMLLSRDAIVSAVEIQLGAGDFYKPAHGHIFEAITSIYAQGEPADPVTVAEELRRAGLLDAVGGPATLVSLQANTPAIGNASRYARIVEEHALLRRLIAVAGEIAEMGYSVPEDVAAAIDDAEALVFDVAQRRVTDSLAPLRDLLERHLDHIEALYERGQDITGIPTGFIDLDTQLAGLQPSNLVIVGGRPGTGKALALDTPLPTPTGWTTMGEVRAGDEVLDERGQRCTVTHATPVMLGNPCFEVAFDDGSTLVADADHQWFAYDFAAWKSFRERACREPSGDQSGKPHHPRVVTTQQMIDEGLTATRDGRPNWHIPLADSLDLPDADLPVDPYDLGCRLGLLRGVEKHIPAAYLRSSFKQRLALLQGLLDNDGTIEPSGTVDLCLSDRILLQQARELVCSLGHKPGPIQEGSIRRPDGRTTKAWRFDWTPLDPVFRLPRKAERFENVRSRRTTGRVARRVVTSIRRVASVPVRCIAVDSPNRQYLAGRSMIPTHNTSFALGIVAHAAVESRTPVLLFSLEMSHLELTQRMLCSEARVDAVRMRNGRLLESDWPKIAHATGRLAEAPVFIDDNPHLTVMEIRAKARRLKSRTGLGLIVIDYLQLMTGRTNAENRQVEVSEISRGLKILARELECPVVALSQLSRNLETRADKRPVLADLRESGCMPASTRILRADNGEDVSLGELVLSQERPLVWSVDGQRRLVPVRLEKAFPSGIKPVFRLQLASGRSVDATANHPFLTVDGWARLDSLEVGSCVAVPRRIPPPLRSGDGWTDDEIVLLAHLLGDGTMGPSFTYTTSDPANKEAVGGAVRRLFGMEPAATKVGAVWNLCFPNPYRLSHDVHHPMRNWLEPNGLWKARAWTKFIPPAIFGLPGEQVALFVRHLWATDGSTTIGTNGRGPLVRTSYATTSRRLALDVQRLLLRLDIRSTIDTSKQQRASRPEDGGECCREVYRVRIQGAGDQARFLRTVGCHGRRRRIDENANVDLVPSDVAAEVRAAKQVDGVSHCQIAEAPGEHSFGSSLVGSPTRLTDIATSDLLWDEVVAITSLGEQPTFDVTIPRTHNFIADGIVAHNSLEQDADVVIFLYRDEVYNRDSPDRGTAEVIVAKHRNGPTGTTQLAFLDHYTRFANMAKGV